MPTDGDAERQIALEAEQAALWEKLKAETDVSRELENASSEQKENWARQENDLRQAPDNSLDAAKENHERAQANDLSQFQMSEAGKDGMLRSIAQDFMELERSQQQEQKQQHEHEQTN